MRSYFQKKVYDVLINAQISDLQIFDSVEDAVQFIKGREFCIGIYHK